MSSSSIDLNTLNELKEIMEDDFNELITIFISDGINQIELLKQAIESSETENIRRIAHTLKGSSSNLGITGLSELSKTLEYSAAENQLADADALLKKISSEFETVKKTLEELL